MQQQITISTEVCLSGSKQLGAGTAPTVFPKCTAATYSPTQQRKDVAYIRGGRTGLKLSDEIMGENSITIWMTRSNSYTGVDTQTGTGSLASVSRTITFTDSDGNGHVTVQEAINQINAQASETKVKAELIDGQFQLTQIDNLSAYDAANWNTVGGANTAEEGDTINYTLAGTGDFAYVTGYGSYYTPSQTNTGSMSNQARTIYTGATTVTGSETLAAGSITFTGMTEDNTNITHTINIAAGETLSTILNRITADGLGVTATIENGTVTFTTNYFTELSISAQGDSDFLRVAGIGKLTIANASITGATATDLGTHYHGVTKSTILTGGDIKSGSLTINGQSFTVIGKTASEIVSAINSSSVARAQLDGSTLIIQVSEENVGAGAVTATGDAARVLGLADYSNSSGSSSAGTYMNHWHYTYDVWTEKTDDWDLTLDYQGYDTPNYVTDLQSKTMYEYMYQTEIWENRSWGWSTTNDSPTGGQYRSQDVDTSYQYGAKYSYMYQTEIWTSRDWGWQLTNGNSTGDGYRAQWSTSSIETNYTDHTTTTYYTSSITGYGVSTQTTSWITGYDTTVSKREGSYSTYVTTKVTQEYYEEYVTSDGGTCSTQKEAQDAMAAAWIPWTKKTPSGGGNYVASTHVVSQNSDGTYSWELVVSIAKYRDVTDTNYTTSTWIDGIDTTITNDTYWTTSYIYHTTTTTWTTWIDRYGVSIETNYTSWYKGGYEERTQDSAWEAKDTGYDSNLTVNNTAPTGSRYKDQSTYSRAIYKGTYQIRTQDSAWETRDTGYNADRTIDNAINESSTTDSEGHTRIRNQQTYSRVWYKETYWTKDSSLAYDTDKKDGYYDRPAFKFTNNATTQYRNVQYSHVIDSISSGSITSGNDGNNSSLDSAFAGQVGGTITVSSSRYGTVGTVAYTASTSAQSILDSLALLSNTALDGNSYKVFSAISSTGATTHGYYGTITMSDSGNALDLLGLSTSSYSDANSRSETTNVDHNGIKKSVATTVGSVGGLTLGSARPFQTSSDGKSDAGGTKSFNVYVGSVNVGTVTYGSGTTVGDIISQINNMQYDYNTGKQVSTHFTNGVAADEDNSFNTKPGNKLENGSEAGYIDGSGYIHYTAQLQASLQNGQIVITSDVYNTTEQKITVGNDTGSAATLLGLETSGTTISTTSSITNGDEGIYTYNGATIAGLKSDTDLTFVGPGTFTVTVDDIAPSLRADTTDTVELQQIKFDVTVNENDSVQTVLDKVEAQFKAQVASKYGVSESSVYIEAYVEDEHIVVKMDGKYGEHISFTNGSSDFVQRTGLSTSAHTYTEDKTSVLETSGYDRITGSVNTITKNLVIGNLTSESFTISGGNGTYTVNIQNGWTVQQIIDAIYSQTSGHYKAGIYNDAIFESNHQQTASNYDSAAKGMFYIESTAQTATDTSVTSSDFTRRMGLVACDLTHGAEEETFKGDHGYFNYYSNDIKGLRPNSIISGIQDGKLTFTLHALHATGETGSIEYRPDITYTIDVAYNDTVTSVLNKMKQAILMQEDETYEHSDVTDTDRVDRLDFHVDYNAATDSGKISLQLIGNYASAITFDNDTSGFMQALGLDQLNHTYNASYGTKDLSCGKAMLTGSVTNLTESKIFGNMSAGSMTLTAGSTTKTINVGATDRILDVINKINEGNIFFAQLDSQGRLTVKTVAQNDGDIEVTGTSDFGQLAGLTAGNWSYTSTTTNGNDDFSKITGSVYGLSATQTFNNMSSGNFQISAAGLSNLTINVTQGSTTVQNVIDQINASADYSATLDDAGRIVISTTKSVGSSITVSNGTSNYASVVGLTAGTLGGNAVFTSGVNDVFSTLKGSMTGLDSASRLSAGDFNISVSQPDGSSISKTFVLSGNETIADVAALISASDLNLSAVLDSSNNSLVLKSKIAGNYSISLKDGTSNFAELTGFTRNGAQANATIEGALSTLTSTNTAHSAQALGFSAGDFTISLLNTDGSILKSQSIIVTATDSVDSIISKINNSGLGLSAAVNSDGKLVIVRNATTSAGGISVTKGSSDFTNKIGLTSGGNLAASTSFSAGENATRSVFQSDLLSANYSAETLASLGISDGTFKINGVSISVKADESIASLLSKINSAFAGNDSNGVYAEFNNSRIILTSNSASENSIINIEAGTSNLTEIMGFTSISNTDASMQGLGNNAIFEINGNQYESLSNIVSLNDRAGITETGSASEVIRINLLQQGSGVIDIGKKSLTDAANKLAAFVNAFNSSISLSQSSYLLADAEFQALQGAIKNSLLNSVGSYKQISKELASMGITVYNTKNAGSANEKLTISLNKDKFVNAYLNNPDKVLGVLIGNDSKPLDSAKAGSMVRLSDTLQNSVSNYFSSTVANLQNQAQDIALQIAQNTSELNNITNTLALGNPDSTYDDMAVYLKQLEDQFDSVNKMIEKMKKNYNQSVVRLSLNPVY